MRDATMQSVATKPKRCEYSHEWKRLPEYGFVCATCDYRPANDSKLSHEAESILHLRDLLQPGDTVYTVIRHVSRSGMTRGIDCYLIKDSDRIWITSYVGHAIGQPQSMDYWRKSLGLKIGGCGMDMGFHVVYSLSRVLFPKGFVCTGEKCRSNDHSNDRKPYQFDREKFKGQKHTGDGGYALRQEWL